jgi:tetratricopeptide (TPR) repeat protein
MLSLLLLVSDPAVAAPNNRPAMQQRKAGTAKKRPGSLASVAKAGSARVRMIAARRAWKADPENIELWLEYGEALSQFGGCDELLTVMAPLSDDPILPLDLLYSMAQCSARLGFYEEAVHYDRLALSQDESRIRGLTLLALHSDMLEDAITRDSSLLELEGLSLNGGNPALLAEATIAVRQGDVDTFEVCMALWERSGWNQRDADRLSAQLWLDLGDPVATLALSTSFRTTRQQGRFIYGEAYRRIGEAPTAISRLENINQKASEGIYTDAMLARAYMDMGDFEQAGLLLEPYLSSQDPEIIASRWYMARLQQDPVKLQQEAELYRLSNQNHLRSLEQLVPWTNQ